ncbi:hypothetical protein EBZ38_09430, partial [bacterium]|nr:hypothetical protein [bacterium]
MGKTLTDIVESYRISTKESLQLLQSTLEGLSTKEAESRQEKNGFNKLEAGKQDRLYIRFFRQFKDLMLILL